MAVVKTFLFFNFYPTFETKLEFCIKSTSKKSPPLCLWVSNFFLSLILLNSIRTKMIMIIIMKKRFTDHGNNLELSNPQTGSTPLVMVSYNDILEY